MFGAVQEFVVFALWIVMLGIKGFAFIDCLRQPAQAFPAIGRQNKVLWSILTGVTAATALLPALTLSLFGIAGIVVALLYIFDIRPKIKEIMGR